MSCYLYIQYVKLCTLVNLCVAYSGQSFLALVPFYNLVDKRLGSGGGVVFDMDGSVKVVVGSSHEEGEALGTLTNLVTKSLPLLITSF